MDTRRRSFDRPRDLRASQEPFRLLVESVRDYAIFMLDVRGHVTTWNLGAERLKGYRADEILGHHFSRFYPDADLAAGKPDRELELAAAQGRLEDEGWRVRKDGSAFWANVVITAVRDETGALVGFAKVTRDLTERKRTEEERLRLAWEQAVRAEAEAAVRAREAFLARASHELRTPLTSALGALGMLRKSRATARPESIDALLEVVDRNLKAMVRLVNDLLDVSKLGADSAPLEREPVDLGVLVRDSLEAVAGQAGEKGVALRALVAPRLVLPADPMRLEQVVVNLVANGVKFTPSGGEVTVEAAADGEDVVIRVRDTGEGIPGEHLEEIFEPFFQVPRRKGLRPRGTGLGLAICRQIVALHGGRVWAESQGPGRGSTFSVRLPRVESGPAAA